MKTGNRKSVKINKNICNYEFLELGNANNVNDHNNRWDYFTINYIN